MDRLNVFAGPRYPEGYEDRLTWALMTLLRLVPLACIAFVDLVRACQERQGGVPIPSLTAMSGCRTHIETQVSHLQARAGQLVAVGITSEGSDMNEEIEAEPRNAKYDGVITFEPPDRDVGVNDDHEPVTLTVESKLGSSVGAWQLKPSAKHLPPAEGDHRKSPIALYPKAVVLAWRDIFRALTGLDPRGLLHPSEAVLVEDFLQYVHDRHPELKPFDRFALCRGDIGLLNRRCEQILRDIDDQRVAHHGKGYNPMIRLDSDAVQQLWLRAEREKSASWTLDLSLYLGDTMSQARAFWSKVDTEKLKDLRESGWCLSPNLHFSFMQRHLFWADTPIDVDQYIDLWEPKGSEKVESHCRDDSNSFRYKWDDLHRKGLISEDDIQKLDNRTSPKRYQRISMSPGLRIRYRWKAADAERFDAEGSIAAEVKRRIREATETWGEVPAFCSAD